MRQMSPRRQQSPFEAKIDTSVTLVRSGNVSKPKKISRSADLLGQFQMCWDVLGCVGKLKQLKLSVIRQDTSTIKYHMSHIQVEEVRWASTRLCRLRAVKA